MLLAGLGLVGRCFSNRSREKSNVVAG
ncbi:hypothetical protein [Nitrosomonas sp.]|nr:hypothetical protein [Nitrosomonas sp.]